MVKYTEPQKLKVSYTRDRNATSKVHKARERKWQFCCSISSRSPHALNGTGRAETSRLKRARSGRVERDTLVCSGDSESGEVIE